MVNVFHVERGNRHTLGMSVAVESVQTLRKELAKRTGIDARDQVLLVSGGEALDNDKKVASYHAGTDTNPIFLFSATPEVMLSGSGSGSSSTGLESSSASDDAAVKESTVESVLSMPPSGNSAAARHQLALSFKDLAFREENLCRQLIHEQHLQHQGWMAVVANLEDTRKAFDMRFRLFDSIYRRFVHERERAAECLRSIGDDLQLLKRLPLLEALRPLAWMRQEDSSEEDAGSDIEQDKDSSDSGETVCETQSEKTLLDWINMADPDNNIESVAQACERTLDIFTRGDIADFIDECQRTIQQADRDEMKEIKGLEERLSGLEQLQLEVAQLVKMQSEHISTYVIAHAGEMSGPLARDVSIINRSVSPSSPQKLSTNPTLAALGDQQIRKMHMTHMQICELRARCGQAKEELCKNLIHRLHRWVVYVETRMSDLDKDLSIHYENLRRHRSGVELLEQVHQTPRLYVLLCEEVVRRRRFADTFARWSGEISSMSRQAIGDEIASRQQAFQPVFQHFLKSLFPGLEQLPSAFGSDAPTRADLFGPLPNIDEADVQRLRRRVPELFDASLEAASNTSSSREVPDAIPSIPDGSQQQLDVDTSGGVDEESQTTTSARVDMATSALPPLPPVDDAARSTCDESTSVVLDNGFEVMGRSGRSLIARQLAATLAVQVHALGENSTNLRSALGDTSAKTIAEMRSALTQLASCYQTELGRRESSLVDLRGQLRAAEQRIEQVQAALDRAEESRVNPEKSTFPSDASVASAPSSPPPPPLPSAPSQPPASTIGSVPPAMGVELGSSDRVSILSCNVGDVVFLLFDVAMRRYTVYQAIRPHLYLVDPKCYPDIGRPADIDQYLVERPEALPDFSRPLVAEVTRKHFCQANRSPNRYNVPLDQRFYRVRVRAWDADRAMVRFEAALQRARLSQSEYGGGGGSVIMTSSTSMGAASSSTLQSALVGSLPSASIAIRSSPSKAIVPLSPNPDVTSMPSPREAPTAQFRDDRRAVGGEDAPPTPRRLDIGLDEAVRNV